MKHYNQIWTEEETDLLKKHWRNYNQRELKEKFFPNKTINQVLQKKNVHGAKGKKGMDRRRKMFTIRAWSKLQST